jgi:hypothetical protein
MASPRTYMDHDPHTIIAKAITGLGVNALALITSMQEHLEWGLRCLSLLVGITVGFVTIFSILRGKRPKKD